MARSKTCRAECSSITVHTKPQTSLNKTWRSISCWYGHHRSAFLLTDDRYHRLVIQLGVIEAVDQVNRPRSRRRHACPDLARELGVRAGHECRHLLVTGLGEHGIIDLFERPQKAIDPVARIAENAVHPPLPQVLEHVNGHQCHRTSLRVPYSFVAPLRTCLPA